MLKRLIISTAAAGLLATGLAAAPADAATGAPTMTAARCHAHKASGHSYWTCITPGSYCPAAAHKRYGYAYKTGKRYRCVKYSNGRWRWKRA
ncbi:hypothetical protein ACQPZ8_01555 [Actinomadura nitritigenes]|uniref:hypothetical protein n=1 Tax=Actinomadura nitritigenes TaxID=134602 RepID=UPI003D89F013